MALAITRAARGLFDSIFNRPKTAALGGYWKTLTAYAPVYTTWQGGIYEAELTRSAIESGAEHASKLKPEVYGTARPRAARALAHRPNPWMTTPQFVRRVWTILDCTDTCIIVPMTDGQELTGYYPVLPSVCEAHDVSGDLWLKLVFPSGQQTAVRWAEVGVLTRHQYRSDLFGDGSAGVLAPTLELMHAQSEAEVESAKRSGYVTFVGKVASMLTPEDQEKIRSEFNRNMAASNAGGIAVYDRRFAEVQQVKPQQFSIDAVQQSRIEKAVYRHFGISEDVILNHSSEDVYNSYYEGRIEPFAVQLGSVLTAMTYTEREVAFGNEIAFSANRLAYASNATKVAVATALFDRGIWSGNDVADVFQTAHYEGGEKHVIRGEYIDLSLISEHTAGDAAAAALTNSAIDGGPASGLLPKPKEDGADAGLAK